MNDPIYQPPQPPLTRADVDRIIDAKIAAHTREGLLASLAGAVALGAAVWAVVGLG